MQSAFQSMAVQNERFARGACFVARHRLDAPCVDRITILDGKGSLTAVVIDGPSSLPDGSETADLALEAILACGREEPGAFEAALLAADHSLASAGLEGQVSSVALSVRDGSVSGASAGDCEAWFIPIEGSAPIELTARQYRRPRIGDTPAPVSFQASLTRGIVVVGTDGLWVNAVRNEVFDIVRQAPPHRVPAMLTYYVFARKGGTFPDDIAVASIEI